MVRVFFNKLSGYLAGIVTAAVINNNALPVGVRLINDRLNRFRKIMCLVIAWNDYGNPYFITALFAEV
ncbi:hypothetical protein ES707_21368 [subsurface metagenome]